MSFRIDTLFKLKKYDIYHNEKLDDRDIKKIAEVISVAKPGTTLNEYFNKVVIDSEMYEGKEIVYHVFQNGMITYYYRDKNPEKEIVAVPKNAKEKLKEIYGNLGIAWEKQEDLVKILTYSAIFILAVIACVGSGGALAPEVAGLFLLFILLTNNGVTEQEGCIEA